MVRTYRAVLAPGPCRQSLQPRTLGSLPAPVAKDIQLRLVDEKNTTGYGRKGDKEREKESFNERTMNKLLNIVILQLGSPTAKSMCKYYVCVVVAGSGGGG